MPDQAAMPAPDARATRINLFSFARPHMRAFHMTWLAFFLAFFGWFGIAPLMAVVRDDLGLTRTQVGNTLIASVLGTVVARLVFGWLTERVGPRRAYAGLLVLGAFPVMGIGLARDYETFLLFRLGISVIGASFVITQYHSSTMFAPNVVGTANATTAGWGNLGGGVAQIVMPLILTTLVGLGVSEALGWRLAMIVPGLALLLMGAAYYFLTDDSPDGRPHGPRLCKTRRARGAFWSAARDRRVWALFAVYAACFGVEVTINNIGALYFHDRFGLSLAAAGAIAGLFGLMNLFARTLGGLAGDRAGRRYGLRGRALLLGVVLMLEGLALIAFSQVSVLLLAVGVMVLFSVFVQMSEGATFSVVPFVDRSAVGPVAGIVGAGGNAGAVLAGLLFRVEGLPYDGALLIVGLVVMATAPLVLLVRFSRRDEAEQRRAVRNAVAGIQRAGYGRVPARGAGGVAAD